MNNNTNFRDEVREAAKARILKFIRKPEPVPVKKKLPENRAVLALRSFNLVMTFLDLISAVAVATLTTWLYGVLTFIAGVGALLIWERLYTNAHAQMNQKYISLGGGILAMLSTLGLGVLSAVVVILNAVGIVSASILAYLEGGMLISLVSIAFLHAVAWAVYYFIDPTHLAEMKRMISIAFREQQKQGLEDAKEDVAAVLEMDKQIQEYENKGQLEYLSAAYEELRGVSIMTGANDPAYQEWLKKGATIPSPLPNDGEPES